MSRLRTRTVSAVGLLALALAAGTLVPEEARSQNAQLVKPAPTGTAPTPLPTALPTAGVVKGDPKLIRPPLSGWADLHTHPMSHLAFGGQLFWGAVDDKAFMTINSQCQPNRTATDIVSALGPENSCNNIARKAIVHLVQSEGNASTGGDGSMGAPMFTQWPKWDDVAHQKMWFEWIERAQKVGKLRVMVGLSHNNEKLAMATQGFGPQRDKESSDLQIMEMKNFVARHPAIMEVATDPSQLYAIASSGRIAVVLGVELDNIGNGEWSKPGKTPEQLVTEEIARLYAQGVRYVFPIHLTDNAFGGTAIYDFTINIGNILKNPLTASAECAPCDNQIGFSLPSFGQCQQCATTTPFPAVFRAGHRNKKGLTSLGEFAIKEMMKRGMIIDIDHMSERSANRALELAEAIPGYYPLMSGHTGLRKGDVPDRGAENSRTTYQLEKILKLGGMMGLGTDKADGWQFGRAYLEIAKTMNRPGSVAIGTDMNSLVHTPKPSGRIVGYTADGGDFPKPKSTEKGPARTWDYTTDGVAQYGMMADFIHDIGNATPALGGFDGKALVDSQLMKSADYFFHMWQKCEAAKVNVR